MRRIIAALHMSLDGLIEGPRGELDWIRSWEDIFDLLAQIDTCILGRGMYPAYEQYWRSILNDQESRLPLTERAATEGEIEYAKFADQTPHVVLSKTMSSASWGNTQIARDVEEIHRLKRQSGKDMHAVGGATLVSSLMNEGLVDELRLVVQPVVLGEGKPLFKDVKERHALTLVDETRLDEGAVRLTYHA
jgi:dihydrofolate reductase